MPPFTKKPTEPTIVGEVHPLAWVYSVRMSDGHPAEPLRERKGTPDAHEPTAGEFVEAPQTPPRHVGAV